MPLCSEVEVGYTVTQNGNTQVNYKCLKIVLTYSTRVNLHSITVNRLWTDAYDCLLELNFITLSKTTKIQQYDVR